MTSTWPSAPAASAAASFPGAARLGRTSRAPTRSFATTIRRTSSATSPRRSPTRIPRSPPTRMKKAPRERSPTTTRTRELTTKTPGTETPTMRSATITLDPDPRPKVTTRARDPSPATARAPAPPAAAATPASMRLAGAELIESREILPGQWLQEYGAPQLVSGARAGQFVHVRTGDYSGLVLRRPFSFNTIDPGSGIVTIHFRTIGRGTEWFTRLRPGDPIDMLGPLGRPFEVDPGSRHLLLVAGGLGMAGVRSLVDEALRDGRAVTVLFGAASARDV